MNEQNDIFNKKYMSWRFWQNRKPKLTEKELLWNLNLEIEVQKQLLKENAELLTKLK